MDHQSPIVETGSLQAGDVPTLPAALCLQWPDEAATQGFARLLAGLSGLEQTFITLHGDLGAGKTTLARHLLQALGVQGRIKSPTYTIAESYEVPGLAIWHFDFYRFNDPQEWEDAGFRDIFASPGLKLAEWPQKAQGLLPAADLDIHLQATGETHRQVRIHALSAHGRLLLQALGGSTAPQAGPGA